MFGELMMDIREALLDISGHVSLNISLIIPYDAHPEKIPGDGVRSATFIADEGRVLYRPYVADWAEKVITYPPKTLAS